MIFGIILTDIKDNITYIINCRFFAFFLFLYLHIVYVHE